ncbi:tRNA (guanosine(46)-N7)-methyltransferase TrmB [Kineosporia succinea]|uniref:tRNA (guanine-N(7)-)-methyltransferase n=1 Tax=Kineosporia succinea TaxID=84632 RepID=A0ABT9PBC1_9ACTN|nr:tRNA (guanosine(46)-N7)-methyltransferase TrmB [Kineosporia succinea]MDP9829990.1 tRNA (guanine-N7-)-methyltransferase [Kineosporia succinea]
MTETPTPAPAVPTYKLRRGRMGAVRREAMATHLHRFELPAGSEPIDLAGLFGAGTPVVLEIGFGSGDSTTSMAAADPGTGVLAADVHTPGVARLVVALVAAEVENVRVLNGDGEQLLRERIPSGSLAGVRVFFPDPWPKARHHKRRLVTPRFAALVADRLAPGGLLHCATDWEPYAEQMGEVLAAEPAFELEGGGAVGRPQWRPVTRYEARGLEKGHRVADFLARRRG